MSQPDRQPNAPTRAVHDIHIDKKGRLSVKAHELASSDAFRTQLGKMVELAKTHPPKTPKT